MKLRNDMPMNKPRAAPIFETKDQPFVLGICVFISEEKSIIEKKICEFEAKSSNDNSSLPNFIVSQLLGHFFSQSLKNSFSSLLHRMLYLKLYTLPSF
jgi:hypothetical protein